MSSSVRNHFMLRGSLLSVCGHTGDISNNNSRGQHIMPIDEWQMEASYEQENHQLKSANCRARNCSATPRITTMERRWNTHACASHLGIFSWKLYHWRYRVWKYGRASPQLRDVRTRKWRSRAGWNQSHGTSKWLYACPAYLTQQMGEQKQRPSTHSE